MCFQSNREEAATNVRINSFLQKENKHNQIKALLLGAGESGKSTFFKQLKVTEISSKHSNFF